MDSILWTGLSRVRGIGIKKLLSLYHASVSVSDLKSPMTREILGSKLFDEINRTGYIEHLINDTIQYIEDLRKNGIEVLSYLDDNYPQLLKNIPDPPVLLYCKGNLKALRVGKKVAVIGTRWPTERGIRQAKKISADFAEMGCVIVSGLAIGIDTAAHNGALDAGGMTIAVLPGSFDNIYPRENIGLAGRILDNGGLLITEYPQGTLMQKRHFVERDRIQSGLSVCVCVIETEVGGGAMHTANFSGIQGRPVFCLRPFDNSHLVQYSGIKKLLNEGTAVEYPGSAEEALRMINGM
ncbi:MAG TPA: DNA-protecting protein DprA [Clostridiaceae bacterium]|nr:DNA-protecting protein DprA [Clostridiaceae bacterium]